MEIRGHSWETNLPARRLVYTRDLYLPVQELAAPHCRHCPQCIGKHPAGTGR